MGLNLRTRLADYLNRHAEIQKNHGKKLEPRSVDFLSIGFIGILEERNRKALDSASEEVGKAKDIIIDMLPFPTYGVFCIDGRIKRLKVYGLVPGAAGFMHVPAGRVTDFKQGIGSELTLDTPSYYNGLLDKALATANTIVELRDAHRDCKAEGEKQILHTNLKGDGGLYENVVRVVQEIDATHEYVISMHHANKRVIGIVTSYDPDSNTLIMGLERQVVLEAGQAHGFTKYVLEDLADRNEIIDSARFIQEDSPIRSHFEAHQIDHFDWVDNFKHSLNLFWINMQAMRSEGLIDEIKAIVREVYNKNFDREQEAKAVGLLSDFIPDVCITEEEIEERAVLLAANAYSAFLTRHKNLERVRIPHDENITVLVEGENGPYKNYRSFAVNHKVKDDVAANTLLAVKIINGNLGWYGQDPEISDPTGVFQDDIESYKSVPKIGFCKEQVRDSTLDWDAIQQISWDDIPSAWMKMDSEGFANYVKTKFRKLDIQISDEFVEGVEELRDTFRRLYDSKDTRDLIEDGELVLLPTLADMNREIQTIIPFIPEGYIAEAA